MNIECERNSLRVNGNEVEFPSTIGEYLAFDDQIVVRIRLEGEDFPDINQNVYSVSEDGSIRWQIAKCPDKTGGGYDAYSGLFRDGGALWVTNLNGMKYRVDLENGKVIDKKFVK